MMKTLVKAVLLGSGSLLSLSTMSASICVNQNAASEVTKPDIIYTQNADGSVTDESTGLVWAKCSLGLSGNDCESGTAAMYNWKDALVAAQSANLHGKTDWRLPNVSELSSLTEKACSTPAINENIFPNTQAELYLTSTSRESDGRYPWKVNFATGRVSSYQHKSWEQYVRLVRDAD